MSANMYDVGVPVPIMDTYVPINFDALYKIGAAQKDEVEKAATQLTTTLQKFGEFHSPSDIDTQNWYKLTLNNPVIGGLIEEASRNPDVLKDDDWRSRFNAGIMGIDYGALSRLMAGKENMLARQKVNQELMMKDMYNPLLHDVDFANYNTLEDGIFNDVSPLGYQSVVDMVKPYVDNLKGRYLGTKNGMIFNGVDDTDTDAQLNKNWSSIIISPHYAQNLQLIKKLNPGISDEEAVNALNNSIFAAGREFTWNKTERDPMAVAKYKHDLDNDSKRRLLNLTDQIKIISDQRFKTAFSDCPTVEDARKKLTDMFKTSTKATGSFYAGVNAMLQILTDPLGQDENEAFMNQGTQSGKMTEQGWRIGNNSSDFILRTDLANNLAGEDLRRYKESGYGDNKLERDFNNGLFKNFLVAGFPTMISDGAHSYHNKYVFIPEKDLKGRGYTDDEIAAIQGDFVTLEDNQVRISQTTNQYGETTVSKSVGLKPGRYLRIPACTIIPYEGNEALFNDKTYTNSLEVDQEAKQQMTTDSQWDRIIVPYLGKNDEK